MSLIFNFSFDTSKRLQQQQGNPGLDNPQLPPLPPLAQVSGGLGSIRPGSMVDRARMAKFPLPEAGLKCPRCDSSHTKFCYYNNYNLSQPRHFCKNCRRYWTKGGALRNVPVGGGCRRNKRSKSNNNNNSSRSGGGGQMGNSNASTSASPSSCSMEMSGHHFSQSSTQFTPLMAAFQNLNNYGGFQSPQLRTDMGFHIGSTNSNNLLPSLAASNFEHHPTNLYPNFQGEGTTIEASNGVSQQVKMEDNNNNKQGMNSSTKQFLGTLENNQYWSATNGNYWTGFSSINNNSSS
ncbi:hypothetical protein RND71_021094 [Anisodus tanguticus]|uniref:Dof zinc finger protein n=1 Tax=Anisodus tanguticus TaxID=243964 RepID=A0AAE1RVC1_9SOLA|nr:hypothetical protein RND71_021094 [Anisodus tanguticus]